MEIFAQTVVSGLLIGFLYALIAVGLTMIFGVMDIVNFAHGDYLMLAMYLAYWSFALLGIDPLYSLPAVTLALFVLGTATYYLLIKRIIDAPMLSQIFVTFGLLIFLRGLAQFLWKADYRAVPHCPAQRQPPRLRRLYRPAPARRRCRRGRVQRPHLPVP